MASAPATGNNPCPALAEVLHEAPQLVQLLSVGSLKNLRLTSLALRRAVQCHLRVLRLPSTFRCDLDTQLLARGNWLYLEVLDLSFTRVTTDAIRQLVQQSHWPNLKHLTVVGKSLNARAIKQLSKGCWPQLASLQITYSNKVVAPEVKHLFCDKWPMLTTLLLTHIKLSAATIAKLGKQLWPYLTCLDLSHTDMSNAAIAQLAGGRWQQLVSLDLSFNWGIADGVSALGSASWQELQSLNLEHCQLSLASVNNLMKGQWPYLHSLNLADNKYMFMEPTDLHCPQPMTAVWTGLKKLDLTDTWLEGVSTAVLKSWCALEYLNVGNNDLSIESQRALATAQFLSLKGLSFSLDFRIRPGLSLLSANLPMLEELDLSYSHNGSTVSSVCKGHWPHVKRLCLANTLFHHVWYLLQGHWPKLEMLNIDHNNMTSKEVRLCIERLIAVKWPLKELSMK